MGSPVSALAHAIGKLVGARLRELRRDAELTQADIERRTGVPRPIISRIERGVHLPDFDTVQRYARALNLDAPTVLVCLDLDWIAAGARVRAELAPSPNPAEDRAA